MSWRRFFERQRRDEELARELEAHLAQEIDDLKAQGLPADEARRRAAQKLGNRTRVREAVYERNSLAPVEALASDVRYALRQLRRRPLFAAVAVGSLALGIGANAAIFSVIDQTLLRRLPVEDPQALVLLYHPGPMQGSTDTDESNGPSFSYPTFRGIQESRTVFTGLAAARSIQASLAYRGDAVIGTARRVSGNYFEVLRVRPALGRLLTPEDDRVPGGHPVVVLSHHYWTRRFDADPSSIGQTLVVNGLPFSIVGVTPRGFEGERHGQRPDVFVTLAMNRDMEPGGDRFHDRRYHWLTLFGRLEPGVSLSRAEAEVQAAYRAELEKDIAFRGMGRKAEARYREKRLVLKEGARGRGGPDGEARTKLYLLQGMTLLVLLIACANLAGLQLTRAAARTRDSLVRIALGAPRRAIVRQSLVESGLVSLAGGLLGLVVAGVLLPVSAAMLPGAPEDFAPVHLDARMAAFTLCLCVVTAVAFGLYPAFRASRPDVAAALRDQEGRASATPGAARFRISVVTGQIALSLLLLVAAGLFTRAFLNLTRIELGLDAEHLVTFAVRPQLNRYDDARARAFYDALRERLSALPGVRHVSAATLPVIANMSGGTNLTVEGFVPSDEDSAHSSKNVVEAGYFRTMGIPLVAGREFTAADTAQTSRVAVVNEAFVRHFFRDANPIGRRLAEGQGNNVKPDVEIVGIARDARYSAVSETPPRVYYLAHAQGAPGALHFYVRTEGDPRPLASAVRRVVPALDPQIPIRGLRTMRAQIDAHLFQSRAMTTFTVAFAALASLLAGLGVYGVLAYTVAQRAREFGIRIALGAGTADVRALVVRELALVLAVGGSLGLLGSALLARGVQAMLYEVRPWDPLPYAAAVLGLGMVVAAGAAGPARRAARVDPILALRHD